MPKDYATLRDEGLADLKRYMDSLDPDKGKKLAYWVKDYAHFLQQEQGFRPDKMIRYKRGAIVKVHLGYRIGAEEGGLHYAVVMDRNNSMYSPTLTVIPLTSVKPGVDISKLHPTRIHLGNEVYTLLINNFNAELRSAKRHLSEIEAAQQKLIDKMENEEVSEDASILFNEQVLTLQRQITYCEKMKKETEKMKQGSIALVGQITTISKIRIYDPKYKNDALSKIRVCAETLNQLDSKVQELFGPPPPQKMLI